MSSPVGITDETVLFFLKYIGVWVGYGVKCHPFNNISVISWGSVLSVEQTGENHRLASNHWQPLYRDGQFYRWWNPEYLEKTTDLPQVTDKLYHIMLYRRHLIWERIKLTTLVVIGTDNSIGSCILHIQLPYDHDHDGSSKIYRKVVYI